MTHQLNFTRIHYTALPYLPALLQRWLPQGKQTGKEYVVRNPMRADKRPGSFKVNIRNGRWADFATGDKGGDIISLTAYLFHLSQFEAARQLAQMLGGSND